MNAPNVRKIVLVIENKLWKLEAEGREFAKFLRSLEQFIQVLVTECFFNISYNDKLEQLELNLGNRKS